MLKQVEDSEHESIPYNQLVVIRMNHYGFKAQLRTLQDDVDTKSVVILLTAVNNHSTGVTSPCVVGSGGLLATYHFFGYPTLPVRTAHISQ